MYRIYKINVEYSRRNYRGREVAPDFMDVLNTQTALYPEKIAESDDGEKIVKEWEKLKREYKYIEKCDNCHCWRGVYIELCSDEDGFEPSYGDEGFFLKDSQYPIYKESDIEWLR